MSCLYHLFNTFFARTIRVVKYKIESTRLNRRVNFEITCQEAVGKNSLCEISCLNL